MTRRPETTLSLVPRTDDPAAAPTLMPAFGSFPFADLDRLRGRLRDMDRTILEAVRQRQTLAAAIGRAKARRSLPIRRPSLERRKLGDVATAARSRGLSPDLACRLFDLLIRASVRRQRRELKDRIEPALPPELPGRPRP